MVKEGEGVGRARKVPFDAEEHALRRAKGHASPNQRYLIPIISKIKDIDSRVAHKVCDEGRDKGK